MSARMELPTLSSVKVTGTTLMGLGVERRPATLSTATESQALRYRIDCYHLSMATLYLASCGVSIVFVRFIHKSKENLVVYLFVDIQI